MADQITTEESPFRASVRLMLKLHALSLQGAGDSAEAAAICAEMHPLWDRMTEQQQELVGGLSEDLYAIEDGGAKQVEMSAADKENWVHDARQSFDAFQRGEDGQTLAFLRRPSPVGVPRQCIPFMQARCWERLGEIEAAILFMKAAERFEPGQAVFVLRLLQQTARADEVSAYADRIVDDPKSTPMERYFAAGALLRPTRAMKSSDAKPILERVAEVLRRALRDEQSSPLGQREVPDGEAGIAAMLGLCYERLADVQAALKVYNEALARYPNDPLLRTMRGIATYETDPSTARADFVRAEERGASSVWPYFFLAHDASGRGDFRRCWELCLKGLERHPSPAAVRAQLHEWLAISRSVLGQPIALILDGFDQALALDPGNDRIRRNRALAESTIERPSTAVLPWRFPAGETISRVWQTMPVDVREQQELLSSRRGRRFADLLAAG